jgi:hypothetical protein
MNPNLVEIALLTPPLSVASQEHSQREEMLEKIKKQTLIRRLDYVVFNKAYFRGESAMSLKFVSQPFYSSGARTETFWIPLEQGPTTPVDLVSSET